MKIRVTGLPEKRKKFFGSPAGRALLPTLMYQVASAKHAAGLAPQPPRPVLHTFSAEHQARNSTDPLASNNAPSNVLSRTVGGDAAMQSLVLGTAAGPKNSGNGADACCTGCKQPQSCCGCKDGSLDDGTRLDIPARGGQFTQAVTLVGKCLRVKRTSFERVYSQSTASLKATIDHMRSVSQGERIIANATHPGGLVAYTLPNATDIRALGAWFRWSFPKLGTVPLFTLSIACLLEPDALAATFTNIQLEPQADVCELGFFPIRLVEGEPRYSGMLIRPATFVATLTCPTVEFSFAQVPTDDPVFKTFYESAAVFSVNN